MSSFLALLCVAFTSLLTMAASDDYLEEAQRQQEKLIVAVQNVVMARAGANSNSEVPEVVKKYLKQVFSPVLLDRVINTDLQLYKVDGIWVLKVSSKVTNSKGKTLHTVGNYKIKFLNSKDIAVGLPNVSVDYNHKFKDPAMFLLNYQMKADLEVSLNEKQFLNKNSVLELQGQVRSMFRGDPMLHPHLVPAQLSQGLSSEVRLSKVQNLALEALFKYEKEFKHPSQPLSYGMIMPVGLGKTLVSSRLINRLIKHSTIQQSAKVIYVVQNTSILETVESTVSREFKNILPEGQSLKLVKYFGAHKKEKSIEAGFDVLLTTRSSLYNRFQEISDYIKKHHNSSFVFVFDEAHHVGKEDGQFSEILNGNENWQGLKTVLNERDRILYMSATLWHKDSNIVQELGGRVWGPFLNKAELQDLKQGRNLEEICRKQIFRAIKMGYLSPLYSIEVNSFVDIRHEKIPTKNIMKLINSDGDSLVELRNFVKSYGAMFSNYLYDIDKLDETRARELVKDINKVVVDGIYERVLRNRIPNIGDRGIIYVPTIVHADMYEELLNLKFGVGKDMFKAYHSKNKTNHTMLLNWFQATDIFHHKYLIVIDSINEGVDLPNINMIVNTRWVKEYLILVQNFGRAVRASFLKPDFRLIDMTGAFMGLFGQFADKKTLSGITVRSEAIETEFEVPKDKAGARRRSVVEIDKVEYNSIEGLENTYEEFVEKLGSFDSEKNFSSAENTFFEDIVDSAKAVASSVVKEIREFVSNEPISAEQEFTEKYKLLRAKPADVYEPLFQDNPAETLTELIDSLEEKISNHKHRLRELTRYGEYEWLANSNVSFDTEVVKQLRELFNEFAITISYDYIFLIRGLRHFAGHTRRPFRLNYTDETRNRIYRLIIQYNFILKYYSYTSTDYDYDVALHDKSHESLLREYGYSLSRASNRYIDYDNDMFFKEVESKISYGPIGELFWETMSLKRRASVTVLNHFKRDENLDFEKKLKIKLVENKKKTEIDLVDAPVPVSLDAYTVVGKERNHLLYLLNAKEIYNITDLLSEISTNANLAEYFSTKEITEWLRGNGASGLLSSKKYLGEEKSTELDRADNDLSDVEQFRKRFEGLNTPTNKEYAPLFKQNSEEVVIKLLSQLENLVAEQKQTLRSLTGYGSLEWLKDESEVDSSKAKDPVLDLFREFSLNISYDLLYLLRGLKYLNKSQPSLILSEPTNQRIYRLLVQYNFVFQFYYHTNVWKQSRRESIDIYINSISRATSRYLHTMSDKQRNKRAVTWEYGDVWYEITMKLYTKRSLMMTFMQKSQTIGHQQLESFLSPGLGNLNKSKIGLLYLLNSFEIYTQEDLLIELSNNEALQRVFLDSQIVEWLRKSKDVEFAQEIVSILSIYKSDYLEKEMSLLNESRSENNREKKLNLDAFFDNFPDKDFDKLSDYNHSIYNRIAAPSNLEALKFVKELVEKISRDLRAQQENLKNRFNYGTEDWMLQREVVLTSSEIDELKIEFAKIVSTTFDIFYLLNGFKILRTEGAASQLPGLIKGLIYEVLVEYNYILYFFQKIPLTKKDLELKAFKAYKGYNLSILKANSRLRPGFFDRYFSKKGYNLNGDQYVQFAEFLNKNSALMAETLRIYKSAPAADLNKMFTKVHMKESEKLAIIYWINARKVYTPMDLFEAVQDHYPLRKLFFTEDTRDWMRLSKGILDKYNIGRLRFACEGCGDKKIQAEDKIRSYIADDKEKLGQEVSQLLKNLSFEEVLATPKDPEGRNQESLELEIDLISRALEGLVIEAREKHSETFLYGDLSVDKKNHKYGKGVSALNYDAYFKEFLTKFLKHTTYNFIYLIKKVKSFQEFEGDAEIRPETSLRIYTSMYQYLYLLNFYQDHLGKLKKSLKNFNEEISKESRRNIATPPTDNYLSRVRIQAKDREQMEVLAKLLDANGDLFKWILAEHSTSEVIGFEQAMFGKRTGPNVIDRFRSYLDPLQIFTTQQLYAELKGTSEFAENFGQLVSAKLGLESIGLYDVEYVVPRISVVAIDSAKVFVDKPEGSVETVNQELSQFVAQLLKDMKYNNSIDVEIQGKIDINTYKKHLKYFVETITPAVMNVSEWLDVDALMRNKNNFPEGTKLEAYDTFMQYLFSFKLLMQFSNNFLDVSKIDRVTRRRFFYFNKIEARTSGVRALLSSEIMGNTENLFKFKGIQSQIDDLYSKVNSHKNSKTAKSYFALLLTSKSIAEFNKLFFAFQHLSANSNESQTFARLLVNQKIYTIKDFIEKFNVNAGVAERAPINFHVVLEKWLKSKSNLNEFGIGEETVADYMQQRFNVLVNRSRNNIRDLKLPLDIFDFIREGLPTVYFHLKLYSELGREMPPGDFYCLSRYLSQLFDQNQGVGATKTIRHLVYPTNNAGSFKEIPPSIELFDMTVLNFLKDAQRQWETSSQIMSDKQKQNLFESTLRIYVYYRNYTKQTNHLFQKDAIESKTTSLDEKEESIERLRPLLASDSSESSIRNTRWSLRKISDPSQRHAIVKEGLDLLRSVNEQYSEFSDIERLEQAGDLSKAQKFKAYNRGLYTLDDIRTAEDQRIVGKAFAKTAEKVLSSFAVKSDAAQFEIEKQEAEVELEQMSKNLMQIKGLVKRYEILQSKNEPIKFEDTLINMEKMLTQSNFLAQYSEFLTLNARVFHFLNTWRERELIMAGTYNRAVKGFVVLNFNILQRFPLTKAHNEYVSYHLHHIFEYYTGKPTEGNIPEFEEISPRQQSQIMKLLSLLGFNVEFLIPLQESRTMQTFRGKSLRLIREANTKNSFGFRNSGANACKTVFQ